MGSSKSHQLESIIIDESMDNPVIENNHAQCIESIKLLPKDESNTSTLITNYKTSIEVSQEVFTDKHFFINMENICKKHSETGNISIIMPPDYVFSIKFIDNLYGTLTNDNIQNHWKFIEIEFKNQINFKDIHFNHLKFTKINWSIQYTHKSIQFMWKQYKSVSNQYVKDSMIIKNRAHDQNLMHSKIKSLTDSNRKQQMEDLENLDYFLKFNAAKKIIFDSFDTIVHNKNHDRESFFFVTQYCSTICSKHFQIHRKLSSYLPIDEFESYELELKCNIVKILPIISNVFKTRIYQFNEAILNLMMQMSMYLDFISYNQWIDSQFIHELIKNLQMKNPIVSKRNVLFMLAKLTSYNVKKSDPIQVILEDLNVTTVLYQYITKEILQEHRDENNKYQIKHNKEMKIMHGKQQLLFSFQVILGLIKFEKSTSDYNVCKWIVNNTYTIKWLLIEWDHGLRLTVCDRNYYPDAYVSAGIFNKLLSDQKIIMLLINEYDILRYIVRSLAFRERTLETTNKLYERVCECLCKISKYRCNFSVIFKYQFEWLVNENMSNTNKNMDVEIKSSVWEKLKWIEINKDIFEDAAESVKKIQDNIQNYYVMMLKENAQVMPDIVLLKIVSWIW
eukprot:334786_1